MSKTEELDSRLRKMESLLSYLKGLVTGLSVTILAFGSVTYFHTIPTAVKEEISKKVGKETFQQYEKARKAFEEAVKRAKIISEAKALQDKVGKIKEVQECKKPVVKCVCQRDSQGKDMAKLVLCVSQCPDGRLRGIEIREIVATTSKFKTMCGKLQSKVF